MIDKYFFKLLLSTWCCLIVILILISFALRQIDTPFWSTVQQKLLINSYSESARTTYDLHGLDGLKNWVSKLSGHDKMQMLIVDEKNETVFNSPKSEEIDINNLVESSLSNAKPHNFNHYVIGPYIINTPHP